MRPGSAPQHPVPGQVAQERADRRGLAGDRAAGRSRASSRYARYRRSVAWSRAAGSGHPPRSAHCDELADVAVVRRARCASLAAVSDVTNPSTSQDTRRPTLRGPSGGAGHRRPVGHTHRYGRAHAVGRSRPLDPEQPRHRQAVTSTLPSFAPVVRRGPSARAPSRSATLVGVDGLPVDVEVHVCGGLPGYTVVGLPDTAGRESRERVRAAMPSSSDRLAAQAHHRQPLPRHRPQDRRRPRARDRARRSCSRARTQLPAGCLDGVGVLGELGLDGSLRPVPGHPRARRRARHARARHRHRPARERARGRARPRPASSGRRRTSRTLRACLEGRDALARPRPAAPDERGRHRHRTRRPRRGPWPRHRAARARDRRRRRPPPPAHRPTRLRQDHARPPPPHDPPAAGPPTRPSRSPASPPSPAGARPTRLARRPAVPRAPPHRDHGRARRRRLRPPPPRRGHPRPPRDAVPRRARRVRAR